METKCCDTCGSMIVNGECSNKNCEAKLKYAENVLDELFEQEFGEKKEGVIYVS